MRADANTALVLLDGCQRQAVDIDQMRRPLDAHLHQVEQIRAAADKTDIRPLARKL